MPQTVPPALTARCAHNGLDHNVRSKPCIVQITAEFHKHGIELLMKQYFLTKVIERVIQAVLQRIGKIWQMSETQLQAGAGYV
jgi:hypothetical protein